MSEESKTDLRAEFVASAWLENGAASDSILFRSLGAFKRRSHGDVEAVKEQEIGNFRGRIIESNRSGIYDHLPEQLFHLPSATSITSLKKKIDEIRFQRDKEQKSRLFFLPLEQELFLNRVSLTQLEQKAFELDPDSLLLEELKAFWQVPDFVPKTTLVRLLPVLPSISENRGEVNVMEDVLSSVTGLQISINPVRGGKFQLETNARLTNARLGIDTMLGGELDTHQSELVIAVQLETANDLDRYMADSNFIPFINWLAGWFVPVECDYNVELTLNPDASISYLTDETVSSRLGYAILTQ